MSKIDIHENNNFFFDLQNEDGFLYSEDFHSHKVVPKLVNDLQQLVNDLLIKTNDLKKLTNILSTNQTFKIPEFMKSFIIENTFAKSIPKPSKLSQLHIGSVDGGLVTSSLAGMDILGIKAVGVYLNYGSSKIIKTRYFPTKHQDITLIPVYNNFSNNDFELYSSLQRSIFELKAGMQLLEESPAALDYLLMDGSFQFKRITTQNTEINVLFGKYFALLRKLTNKAESQNTKLLFIVKDSKVSSFVTILSQLLPHIISTFSEIYSLDYRTILQNLRDSTFMHYLLQPRTRSFIINRAFLSPGENEIKDTPYSFYLKIVKNDIPLRIDMLTRTNKSFEEVISSVDEISKVVLGMSEFNKNYSLPAPIIEADARARINLEEFDLILDYIRNKTFNYNSIEGLKLRRSRSPFKFT